MAYYIIPPACGRPRRAPLGSAEKLEDKGQLGEFFVSEGDLGGSFVFFNHGLLLQDVAEIAELGIPLF